MDSRSSEQGQYSEESIDHYEAIFGRDFVSPGGEEMARELISRLELAPGSRVLDVGCGLGGAGFLMAQEFELRVDGIDVSANMIQRARARLAELELGPGVSLTLGDCLDLKAHEAYDAIYSRDVFLHINDKERLFRVLHRALKPGGTLLFTDYCCGNKPWQPDFEKYVTDRRYCLHTVPEYRAILEGAGFLVVAACDWTDRFIRCLREETKRISTAGFDAETAGELERSWLGKIERANGGDHRWGMFTATR